MKIHIITIDLGLPRWAKRLIVGVSVPLAVLGVGAGVVWAAGTINIKTDFADGQVLTATQLNANFGAIQAQGNDHEARLGTLEGAVPQLQTLVSESLLAEGAANAYGTLTYQSAKLDLTPGTWLVNVTASGTTLIYADCIQISLWDELANAEVQHSRGVIGCNHPFIGAITAPCDGVSMNCSSVALTTTVVIPVTANTTIRIRAHANGNSKVYLGSPAPLPGMQPTTRMTAVRIK